MTIHMLSVDLQNDFTIEGGVHYHPRPCVPFIRNIVIPFIRERSYTIAEIISDYRATLPAPSQHVCAPDEWGYQSLIPSEVKHPSVWVKAEPSPAWIREGGGQAGRLPGTPYPDPDAFSAWLTTTIGPPSSDTTILLMGLTLEICVFSTLQELHYRGYETRVLFEGVDTYSGDEEQKRMFFDTIFPFWGSAVAWCDIQTAIQ